MKKTLIEETKRIFEIISTMDKSVLLTELNEKYLNKLLDKINQTGVESLTDGEKTALDKMSRGENVPEPEKFSLGLKSDTLRFTTNENLYMFPAPHPLYGAMRHDLYFIHGEAKKIAGADHPLFIDGDMSQLDKPEDEQDIRMILPKGEYECTAILGTLERDSSGNKYNPPEPCYLLDLLKAKESELDEGNAFIAALNKAKENGKNSFEIGGKTYDVK